MSHFKSTLKVTPCNLAKVTWTMCCPLMTTGLTWASSFAEENTKRTSGCKISLQFLTLGTEILQFTNTYLLGSENAEIRAYLGTSLLERHMVKLAVVIRAVDREPPAAEDGESKYSANTQYSTVQYSTVLYSTALLRGLTQGGAKSVKCPYTHRCSTTAVVVQYSCCMPCRSD